MYEVNGWYKYAEQDDHEEGCLPGTGFSFGGNERWSADNIPDLLIKLRNFVGVDDEYEIELDCCDEDGRVDISVLETADSYTAMPYQIEEWREGKLKLWASCYTFMVEEVERKTVRLSVE
jgi:hypothetical protein